MNDQSRPTVALYSLRETDLVCSTSGIPNPSSFRAELVIEQTGTGQLIHGPVNFP
jgi:hypothetical protein